MVASLNQAVAPRELGYETIQYICARVTAVAGGTTQLVKIGSIPIGSVIVGIHNRTATTFAGGTPLLTIGSNASAYNNLNATLSEAAGSELVQPLTAFGGPLATDVEFWASMSGGATSGDAVISIWFIKPLV